MEAKILDVSLNVQTGQIETKEIIADGENEPEPEQPIETQN